MGRRGLTGRSAARTAAERIDARAGSDDATPEILTTDVPRRHRLERVFHMALSAPVAARRRLTTSRERPEEVPPQPLDDAPRRRSSRDFDAFYAAQYRSVVRLAYSLCGSMPVAEELAQEAFLTAHKRWSRLEGFDRPDLWVRRVVINRSISFRRRETNERKAVERIRIDQRSEQTEPVVSDEVVWQALRELSPRQAEVLALFYVEDQPLSAVAEILGLGPETVKTHLKRGRAALASKLEELGHVR